MSRLMEDDQELAADTAQLRLERKAIANSAIMNEAEKVELLSRIDARLR